MIFSYNCLQTASAAKLDHYMMNLSHFGTEMYLSRAKTVTVCSLSYSWWEGPDVPDIIRPELPVWSGPSLMWPDRTSGPFPAGRVRCTLYSRSLDREAHKGWAKNDCP